MEARYIAQSWWSDQLWTGHHVELMSCIQDRCRTSSAQTWILLGVLARSSMWLRFKSPRQKCIATHQRYFDKMLLINNTYNLMFLSKNKEHIGGQNQMHIK